MDQTVTLIGTGRMGSADFAYLYEVLKGSS
jgi:hypothetical protein